LLQLFRSSSALASAYGIAVSGTMVVTESVVAAVGPSNPVNKTVVTSEAERQHVASDRSAHASRPSISVFYRAWKFATVESVSAQNPALGWAAPFRPPFT
jgi:hypothetical protein